jgi:hypothetical protein
MVLASGNISMRTPMSATFNVSLVLDNFELCELNLTRLFGALPDAVPAAVGGVVTLTTPVVAADAKVAAFELVDVIGDLFPTAVVRRLDQDLVSISDIAERTERSRESVRLLVEGKRGPGGFPAPVGIVGDGIRIWPWAVVVEWFASRLDDDLGERGIPPEVAAVVDARLATRKPHAIR